MENTHRHPDRLLRLKQVAESIGISLRTLNRLISSGVFRPVKVLRSTAIPESEVCEFIERLKRERRG